METLKIVENRGPSLRWLLPLSKRKDTFAVSEGAVTMTTEDILEAYGNGRRDFRNLDLDDGLGNFDKADLSGAMFSGCFIVASFRNANLEGADFSGSNIKTCDFSGANLKGSSFKDALVDAVLFDGADLTGVDFEGASNQGHVYLAGEAPT